MREKEAFRDNLERILAAYPGKEMLSITEVAAFTGLHRSTCCKLFPPLAKRHFISAATLARLMS